MLQVENKELQVSSAFYMICFILQVKDEKILLSN